MSSSDEEAREATGKTSLHGYPMVRSLSEDGLVLRRHGEEGRAAEHDEGDEEGVGGVGGGASTPSDKKPPKQLLRAKTLDPVPSEEFDTRRHMSITPPKKHNRQFHKLFKSISHQEELVDTYTCALQKDIVYQGRLFVSKSWICFHANLFGKSMKIAVPVCEVTAIHKDKTARLVPNAVRITTTTATHTFVSLLSRETTLKVLRAVCTHLETFPDVPDSPKRGRDSDSSDSSRSNSPERRHDKLSRAQEPSFDSVDGDGGLYSHNAPAEEGDAAAATHNAPGPPSSGRSLGCMLCTLFLTTVLLVGISSYLAMRIAFLERHIHLMEATPGLTEQWGCLSSEPTADGHSCLNSAIATGLNALNKVQADLRRLLDDWE
ncbi:GRAM domain-containing protein 2A-like isoform X1 [Lethenteron reissneri]|uniref:GRAM domain-containing protein 2A-like isoform X1 n=1 Tax=Lethenteron reissneri TaxID=7753 RepID=UPI002AB6C22C|nr:GRAM domain-containing protein 2A-like isoform X1 [Lethenteron reissneri]XP_061423823.1 GRAM domain-containing protein 2A-like isoform X1 [Lethenteron reissneri]